MTERMQPVVSVVTAVSPACAEYLPETWESLVDQDMPEGWSWEWLVQCDSTEPHEQQHVLRKLPDDDRVSFAANRFRGPAITRTMTLARAHGRLVKTLDADDRLTPGALARDVAAHQQPGVMWSASHVLNEYPDGSRGEHYSSNPKDGRIIIGAAGRAYERDFRIIVHPATLCVRYSLLVALGGWMALPASEDTGLLMACDAFSDGWFNGETGLIYRRWPEQMSQSAEHVDTYELDVRRTMVQLRSAAVEDLFTPHD